MRSRLEEWEACENWTIPELGHLTLNFKLAAQSSVSLWNISKDRTLSHRISLVEKLLRSLAQKEMERLKLD